MIFFIFYYMETNAFVLFIYFLLYVAKETLDLLVRPDHQEQVSHRVEKIRQCSLRHQMMEVYFVNSHILYCSKPLIQ